MLFSVITCAILYPPHLIGDGRSKEKRYTTRKSVRSLHTLTRINLRKLYFDEKRKYRAGRPPGLVESLPPPPARIRGIIWPAGSSFYSISELRKSYGSNRYLFMFHIVCLLHWEYSRGIGEAPGQIHRPSSYFFLKIEQTCWYTGWLPIISWAA